MLTTITIALREFLEAFLIAGVFLGISKKLKLKKEKEICLAILLGTLISFSLPIITFYLSNKARLVLTERKAELLEGYLSLFSGVFLTYVIFSFHNFFMKSRAKDILFAHKRLEKNNFNLTLFLTLIFIITREGFEIALFTATTSLFSEFVQNIIGLILGFTIAGIIGIFSFTATIKFPLGKIYKFTEYLIILLGASFVNRGIKELLEVYFDLHLSEILSLNFSFLPSKKTLIGSFLYSFFSLEKNLSLISLLIALLYILGVKRSFRRR